MFNFSDLTHVCLTTNEALNDWVLIRIVLKLFAYFLLITRFKFIFTFILGSCSQLYWAMHAVILVDYLTVAKLKSSLGFMTLCHGMAISVMLPVAGK